MEWAGRLPRGLRRHRTQDRKEGEGQGRGGDGRRTLRLVWIEVSWTSCLVTFLVASPESPVLTSVRTGLLKPAAFTSQAGIC